MHVKPWHACAAAAVTLVALASSATAAEPEHDYANQTPYGTPEASVQEPPAGYEMFFLETVARHGARSLTGDAGEQEALATWQRASDQGGLTELGQSFARDVKEFQEAEKKIGYGKLSGLGREEWQGIGKRHAETYADFFKSLDRRDEKIASVTTSVERTQQSAKAMHEGLTEGGLDLKSELAPLTESDDLLRIRNKPSSAGEAMTEEILDRDAIREHAESVLRTIYVAGVRRQHQGPGRRRARHLQAVLDRTRHGEGHRRHLRALRAAAGPRAAQLRHRRRDVLPVRARHRGGDEHHRERAPAARRLLQGARRPRRPDRRPPWCTVSPTARRRCRSPRSSRLPAARSRRPKASGSPAAPTRGAGPRPDAWPATSSGRPIRNDQGKILVTMRYNENPGGVPRRLQARTRTAAVLRGGRAQTLSRLIRSLSEPSVAGPRLPETTSRESSCRTSSHGRSVPSPLSLWSLWSLPSRRPQPGRVTSTPTRRRTATPRTVHPQGADRLLDVLHRDGRAARLPLPGG